MSEEDEYRTVLVSVSRLSTPQRPWRVWVVGRIGRKYLVRLFRIHTSPSVHPTVVSPRSVAQSKTKSRLNSDPATSAVKRMSTEAHV